jgi:hypothetical protein
MSKNFIQNFFLIENRKIPKKFHENFEVLSKFRENSRKIFYTVAFSSTFVQSVALKATANWIRIRRQPFA